MKTTNPLPHQRRTLTGLAVLTLTLLSGCTATSDGTALPSTQVPSTVTPADPFNGLKACEVLDKAIQGQGFPPAVVVTAGGDNGCKADKALYGGLTVTLRPVLGIDDLNADKSKQHNGNVKGRRAIQIREGLGSSGDCAVAITVTNTSRALMAGSLSTGTTDEACTFHLRGRQEG